VEYVVKGTSVHWKSRQIRSNEIMRLQAMVPRQRRKQEIQQREEQLKQLQQDNKPRRHTTDTKRSEITKKRYLLC
jgi:hypothetical protein